MPCKHLRLKNIFAAQYSSAAYICQVRSKCLKDTKICIDPHCR